MRGRLSTSEWFRHKKGKAYWSSPHPSRLTPSHLPPGEGYFQPHPAIAAQSRRAAKQGMSQAHTNHRRAAAGGERSTTTSLHPRRSIFLQASLRNGSPGPGPQTRRTLATFLRGKVARPQAEHPRPRPPQRAKSPRPRRRWKIQKTPGPSAKAADRPGVNSRADQEITSPSAAPPA